MNTLVISKLSDVSIALAPEAIADRDKKLADAKAVTAITDAFQLECAVDSVRELKSILSVVEKTRVEVKSPVLDLGRRIDSLAKEFGLEVEKESRRINGLINSWQAEQQRQRDEQERARQAELRRIEAERQAAEQARQKAIRDAETANAAGERKQREADAEIERQRQEKLKAEHAKVAVAPVVPAYVPSGVKTKKVWRFEVEDISKVALGMPELVRMEANVAAINYAISGGMRYCPGLRIWEETDTRIR